MLLPLICPWCVTITPRRLDASFFYIGIKKQKCPEFTEFRTRALNKFHSMCEAALIEFFHLEIG